MQRLHFQKYSLTLLYPPQIPIRDHGDEEFVLDSFVNLKFWVSFEMFPDDGFGVVAYSPESFPKHFM